MLESRHRGHAGGVKIDSYNNENTVRTRTPRIRYEGWVSAAALTVALFAVSAAAASPLSPQISHVAHISDFGFYPPHTFGSPLRTETKGPADRRVLAKLEPEDKSTLATAVEGLSQVRISPPVPQAQKTKKKGPFSLNTKFRERKAALQENSGNRHSYWDLRMKSKVGRHISTTGQLAFSSFDPFAPDDLGDDQDRAFKLGVKGKLGKFAYGTGYSAIGKEFRSLKEKDDDEKNLEKMQLWGSWQLGRLGVRTALIEENSNIHDDPKRPHMTERGSRVSLSYQFLDWPSLGYTLSYQDSSRSSSQEPSGYSPYEGTETSVDGSLYVSANKWKASLDSYWVTSDDLSDAEDYRIVGHGLSGSYYPRENLSFWASVSAADEYYDSDQSHTQSRWVALTVDKALARNRVHFSGYASYYTDTNRSWSLDTEGFYTEAGILWALGTRKEKTKGIKLFLSYNLYTDNIYPDSDSNELAAWIVYKFNYDQRSFHRSLYSRLFEELD